jgi:subtilisin-like proprotein convertase family protein
MRFLRRLVFATVCTFCFSVNGALSSANFPSGSLNKVIPDGNPAGYADTITVSGMESSLVSVSVGLQVSGGWNGDLYAYLTHGETLVVLLNRVGRFDDGASAFGYSDSGFNITLGTTGTDIHDYQSVPNYATLITQPDHVWKADGRLSDPNTVTFATPPSTSLVNFNNANPNGDWTLFLADMSGGGVSTLGSWSLNIEAVPEPATIALAIAGCVFGCFQFFRHLRSRKTGVQRRCVANPRLFT